MVGALTAIRQLLSAVRDRTFKRELKGGPEYEPKGKRNMSKRPKAAAQPLANHTPANESPQAYTCAPFHFSTFAR